MPEDLSRFEVSPDGRDAQDDVPAPDIPRLIERLKKRYQDRITAEVIQPAKAGRYADFPEELDGRLKDALRSRGIDRLYSHQREAWDAVAAGRHTVVVTPTASGKTLCYNLPALHAAMTAKAKALYIFPTKALSQDQVAEIMEINEAGGLGVRAYTFDGDTPSNARQAVRTKGDIVVTNPDMLHTAVLPHHTKWSSFFEGLRYVIIDELHIYKGVFGSHVANVIRRLKRVCAFYGVEPVFIMSSATIANPKQLAEQVIGEPVAAVTESGAPHGQKHLLLWNPPVINEDLGIRASARSQSTRIARATVRAGFKTIIFAHSRTMVEILTFYMKQVFDHDPRKPPRVHAYRGGYLPTERRDTERKMRAGQIDCIVSTSALELGVDIGALDVCVLNGYPGSIAGTWQRLGRAGRRNQTALGVMVASSLPLDQYIVRNPDFFLGASPEHARIDPDQLLILMQHIRCAAFELPFTAGEKFGPGEIREALDYLVEEGELHFEAGQWHWMSESYPANSVSLRSLSEGNFVVIDVTDGKKEIIAEVDYSGAPMTIYEGAIYMVQAQPWQVEKLDWEGRKAFVTKTQADYYTDAIDYTKLKILDEFDIDRQPRTLCANGEVHIVRRFPGYKKIRYYTHENIGFGNINLPDQEMHTTALWWQIDPKVLEAAFPNRWQALDGFIGAAYTMHFVACLLTMSERQDLGKAVGDSQSTWFAALGDKGRGQPHGFDGQPIDIGQQEFRPTIFIYDNYPGGIGLTAPLYDLRRQVAKRAHELVSGCGCKMGCPACIGPILSSEEGGGHSPKQAALAVLRLLRDEEEAPAPWD